MRAQLGNDLAIKAFRDGILPFPDGAIIAALHWNEESSDADNQALAAGFPSAGLKSSFAGSAVNVQFMVKDSKKYAASGGWGFADFTKGKPGNEALHEKCFPCPRLQKIATTFSLATHLRPELKRAGRSSGRDRVGLLSSHRERHRNWAVRYKCKRNKRWPSALNPSH